MRIIFLDFDGVLNSQYFFETRGGKKSSQKYPFNHLDERAVANLNSICKQTGAKIVVSSSWRSGETAESLQRMLGQVGFAGEVIDVTPYLPGRSTVRGNEIYEWIQANVELLGCHSFDFNSYVIIDDDSDFLWWQREHLIITDAFSGLTPDAAYRAVNILKKFSTADDAKNKSAQLLVDLRSQWIDEQKKFPPESRESLRLHFGIYALDEAINSIEAGEIWRYDVENTSLDFMLVKPESPGI